MSFCCKCKAGICKTQDCDSFCDCHPQEYPNDKETQEWMNAPLGKPISTPEEQFKFWSDKYDAKVDELHEMWKTAKSFEGSFNAATESIERLEKEVSFLKESRSKWAKQSSENADNLEKALASWHMKCIRLEDRIDLMCDEFKRIKLLTDNREIHGLCDRAMQDIKQNISVIAQRDNAEAREIVLRRNLENAYAEAKRIYPEFHWDGFTQTSEIIVMALHDKIKKQAEALSTLSHEGLGREEIRTLWEYADHKGDCRRFDVGKSCSCGFDTILKIKGGAVSKLEDKDGLGSLLWAVKLAYRKFHLDDDDLSEREVCDSLCDALCNEMGDNGFQNWLRVNSKRIKALKQLRGGK